MADEQTSSGIVSSSDYNDYDVSVKYESVKHEMREREGDRNGNRTRSRERRHDRSRDRKRSRERHSRRSSRDRRRSRSRSRDSKRRRRESSHEYRKEYRYWDVPPPGYEHVTPAEFKALQAAGQVLPTLYTTESSMVNMFSESMIDPHPSIGSAVSRQARRIYVGNIPLGVTEQGMMEFFNEQVKLKGYTQAEGDPVIAVQINPDKNFAFIEFRSVEETSQGLNLDGVMYNGFPLKLRRPRDYVALAAESFISPVIAGVVQDTPHKLFVGGLPHYLSEDQVKELLLTFGQLSGFNLVKDASTGLSKGYAFCEYADHSVTDKACLGLTGMQLGEKKIVVQRASLGAKTTSGSGLMMVRPPGMDSFMGSTMGFNVAAGGGVGLGGQETEILCLHNMITVEDLVDDEEYEEIMEDVREECGKYGRVVSVQIPRPMGSSSSVEKVPGGVGKVYVEFSTRAETVKAMRALAGRTFSGRVVVTSFYDPERYRNGFF